MIIQMIALNDLRRVLEESKIPKATKTWIRGEIEKLNVYQIETGHNASSHPSGVMPTESDWMRAEGITQWKDRHHL